MLGICLKAVFDVANTIQYLHDKNIIHRDNKPSNIGFDRNNVIKVFDLGMAKEIKFDSKSENNTYRLTGERGSYPYVAPEIAMHKPYNLSADVYSSGFVLWEVCKLEKSLQIYDQEHYVHSIIRQEQRQKMDRQWQASLRLFTANCWSTNIYKRPKMGRYVQL